MVLAITKLSPAGLETPTNVHVTVDPLSTIAGADGDWLDWEYTWDFGDATNPYSVDDPDPARAGSVNLSTSQHGMSAAYYARHAATFTITLTARYRASGAWATTSVQTTYTVAASTRTPRYIDPAAVGLNNGTSEANAWTSMNSITQNVHDTEFLFKAGATITGFRKEIWGYHNLLYGRYGAGADPIITINFDASDLFYVVSSGGNQGRGDCKQIRFEHLDIRDSGPGVANPPTPPINVFVFGDAANTDYIRDIAIFQCRVQGPYSVFSGSEPVDGTWRRNERFLLHASTSDGVVGVGCTASVAVATCNGVSIVGNDFEGNGRTDGEYHTAWNFNNTNWQYLYNRSRLTVEAVAAGRYGTNGLRTRSDTIAGTARGTGPSYWGYSYVDGLGFQVGFTLGGATAAACVAEATVVERCSFLRTGGLRGGTMLSKVVWLQRFLDARVRNNIIARRHQIGGTTGSGPAMLNVDMNNTIGVGTNRLHVLNNTIYDDGNDASHADDPGCIDYADGIENIEDLLVEGNLVVSNNRDGQNDMCSRLTASEYLTATGTINRNVYYAHNAASKWRGRLSGTDVSWATWQANADPLDVDSQLGTGLHFTSLADPGNDLPAVDDFTPVSSFLARIATVRGGLYTDYYGTVRGETAGLTDVGAIGFPAVAGPNAPNPIFADEDGATAIIVTITDTNSSPNEDGTSIEVSNNGSTGWTELVELAANVVTYRHPLPENTTKFYKARTRIGAAYSPYTGVVSATTTSGGGGGGNPGGTGRRSKKRRRRPAREWAAPGWAAVGTLLRSLGR